ncbi:MAG TPA: hypothetical protein VMG38_01235 [Trebonia sp.]|nr:hypothetical protein [Trebonia sp.]
MKFPPASPSRRRLTCAAGVAAATGAAAWWFSDKAPYPGHGGRLVMEAVEEICERHFGSSQDIVEAVC